MIKAISGSFVGTPVNILSGVPIEDDYVAFKLSDYEYAVAQGDLQYNDVTLTIDNAFVTIYDTRGYSEYVNDRLIYYPTIRTVYDDVRADVTKTMVYSSFDGFPHLSQADFQTSNLRSLGLLLATLLVFFVLWGFLSGSVLRLRGDL